MNAWPDGAITPFRSEKVREIAADRRLREAFPMLSRPEEKTGP
jgi:hypothetical protein